MADRADLAASTTIAGVIGSPIGHSRSPAIVNAAFEAMGVDWAFVAFEVAAGDGPAAVAAMRALRLGGLSVTMPHKHDVVGAVDRLSPAAEALRAVNCIAWDGDHLVGHSTDGAGLVRSLQVDEGIGVAGLRCAVLGAGGAARSVVQALAAAGAASVVVINRTADRAQAAAELAGPVGSVGGPEAVGEADLVINATSVGMGATGDEGPSPLDHGLLEPRHRVVDLVYQPVRTPLLLAAERVGATTVDGIGMLVHQAAIAVELWTGRAPDLDAMQRAART